MKHDNIQSLITQFWNSLVDTNDELNAFINGGLPVSAEKRHKSFVQHWDKMKEKAEALCDEIEQQSSLSVDQIDIKLPWTSQKFKDEWQMWKDYLIEQHNKRMKSRMEYAALAHLKNIADNKESVAIEYLQFAMAGGYPRFFKVTNKNYESPTVTGVRGDGDY